MSKCLKCNNFIYKPARNCKQSCSSTTLARKLREKIFLVNPNSCNGSNELPNFKRKPLDYPPLRQTLELGQLERAS